MKSTQTKMIIDRFENDMAVCLVGSTQILLPRGELPKTAREGDILLVTFQIHENETQKEKQRTRRLIDQLKQKNASRWTKR